MATATLHHDRREIGENMKINFTKKEYQALVEMLLMADWVLTAHELDPDPAKEPYAAIRKKVLAYHKEMGMEDAFRYDPKEDEYLETAEYEEQSKHMRFIREYDEQSFWSEFADKLAQRDLAEQLRRQGGSLDGAARAEKFFELMTRYEEELSENGLDNVRLRIETPRMH
jgi:hypothetical protein